MSLENNQKSVVVIGGGAIGVSSAVHLLRQGAQVALVTEAALGSGASGRSLSWLNSAGERAREYHALRMTGIDRYRTLFARHPDLTWLRFDGGLYWAADDDRGTQARHAYEKAHGYDSALVSPENIAAFTQNIAPQAMANSAIYNAGEGWVSLPHLIGWLMEEFHQLGGQLIEHAGKATVKTDASGRACGVTTARAGELAADTVLVACGPQTPELVAPLGVTIPNGSPVSMLVTTDPVDTPIEVVMNTPRAAVRPNPGNTLAVDHDWYEEHITSVGDGEYRIPEPVVQELLNEASKLIAGQPALRASGWKIGLKPIPGDGNPVFGELQKVPGCFVAFTHSGATLALIAGELLAEEIVSGEPHPMFATFRAERFSQA
ncbi:D-amino-acid oxidase [Mixta theicola]|uniref:D-amino-acid oxidase n=1 Tax=Mixta theicola TaxID=1458355 RepID=A0A2K1Q564_9GAMM|nr:FAD-binding oxidoreductase [Mixta theicola]PNS10195.1 D-amino-acid oxidase [Mixta theicola]GLR08499.1 D-amino-acid oxidase [Mixta theicola]